MEIMKRKKTLFLILATLMVSTLLSGCGSKKNSSIDKPSVDRPKEDKTTEDKKPKPEPKTEATTEDKSDDVEIVPTKNALVEWEDYITPDGYMTCKIPTGWQVETVPCNIIDYQLIIYDPTCPARMVFFAPTETAYKSQAAVDFASMYDYTGADWSICPINTECTTSSFFANSGQFFNYSNFNEIENLGENGWGGSVIQASCTFENTECEGIFTCSTVLPLGTMYNNGIDIAPTAEYGTTVMIAPEDEFPSWEPVLLEIFSSIVMTEEYQQARAKAWRTIIGTSEQLAAVANYTSDLIMSGWESRNNTYDILSQRTSDATMGRDRVYDTDTGEVYYTDLGWYDTYDGTRFEYIGEGSSYYNLPVTGTIE